MSELEIQEKPIVEEDDAIKKFEEDQKASIKKAEETREKLKLVKHK